MRAISTPLCAPTSSSAKRCAPPSSCNGPYSAIAAGSAVKLRTRTKPRTPFGPVMMPRQMRPLAAPSPSRAMRGSLPLPAGERVGVRGLSCSALCLPRCIGDYALGAAGAVASAGAAGAAAAPPFARSWAFARGADFWFRHQPSIAEEAMDPLARQRAHLQPMLNALGLHHQALGMALVEHRIVGAELFEEASVARAARIRHHDAVEWALLGAAARHANFETHEFSLLWCRRISAAVRPASALECRAVADPFCRACSSASSCRPCLDIASAAD